MPYHPQQTVFRVSFVWVHAVPLPDEKSPSETLQRRLLSTEDRLSSFLLLKVKAYHGPGCFHCKTVDWTDRAAGQSGIWMVI
ncbi:hypothetical protein N7463_005807 [Penicillium fimorum]|uniref:Uncharacterized protein n=1 Tax=Penicillium fimorum TaxID=1882269 RepID=A0A9W9XT93_9EURO|nr:hypothetical protein N7463_005807 [Penicillium fimorum]